MAKLPGSVWIDGDAIHFINESGVEYYYIGNDVGIVPGLPGCVWIEGPYLVYIDANSHKRGLEYTDDGAAAAIAGCIWVEGSRIKATSGTNKLNYHFDVVHGDIIHDDVTHIDGGGGHTDYPHEDFYSDVPHDDITIHGEHQDYGPQYCDGHYDVGSGAEHQDAFFNNNPPIACYGDYSPPVLGGHGDASISYIFEHTDVPHLDGIHQDNPRIDDHDDVTHGDSASHSDLPHTDVPHSDVTHADQPVLVGP